MRRCAWKTGALGLVVTASAVAAFLAPRTPRVLWAHRQPGDPDHYVEWIELPFVHGDFVYGRFGPVADIRRDHRVRRDGGGDVLGYPRPTGRVRHDGHANEEYELLTRP